MEKNALLKEISLPPWQAPTLPDLGDSINDTQLICADGNLFVERSFLCWSSQVFWRIFKSGIGTIEKEDQFWVVRLPDDSSKIVDMAYQISKRLFVKLPVSYEGKTDDQTTVDLIQFADQYEFVLLLDLLKRAITGLIDPRFSKSKQCYFDLDRSLNLNIRAHLVRAWFHQTLLLKPTEWKKVEIFEDLDIYTDLFMFAFLVLFSNTRKARKFLPSSPEVLHLQKMLIISFILSELDFRHFSEGLRYEIKIPSDFKLFPFEPIFDPELQKEMIQALLAHLPIIESDPILYINKCEKDCCF